MARILIVDGHPDPEPSRFCHAIAQAYADGSILAGHTVDMLKLGALDIPFIRSKEDWENEVPVGTLADHPDRVLQADHLVFIYPLWMGTMPALLKAWFEQVMRAKLAFEIHENGSWTGRLKGRSARIIITMGMPAFAYRWFFLSHSLKNLERNILKFAGVKPVRSTLIGMIEHMNNAERQGWLEKMGALGRQCR